MLAVNIELIVKGRVSPEMYDRAGAFLRGSPVAQNFIKRLAMATMTDYGAWEFTLIPPPVAADLPPVPTDAEVAKGRAEAARQTKAFFDKARERVQEHCRRTGATGGGPAVEVDVNADVLKLNADKTYPTKSRKSSRAPGPRRSGGLFARS